MRNTLLTHTVISETPHYKFHYDLHPALINIEEVQVEYVSITNSMPTIVAGWNDTFSYLLGGVPHLLVIDEGNYTLTQFATVLEDGLNVQSGGGAPWVVEITGIGGMLIWKPTAAGVGFLVDTTIHKRIGYVMGIEPDTHLSVPVNVGWTTGPVNVAPWLSVTIESDTIDRHVALIGVDPNGFSSATLISIPLDVGYMDTKTYVPATEHIILLDYRSTLTELTWVLKYWYADRSHIEHFDFPIQPWTLALAMSQGRDF